MINNNRALELKASSKKVRTRISRRMSEDDRIVEWDLNELVDMMEPGQPPGTMQHTLVQRPFRAVAEGRPFAKRAMVSLAFRDGTTVKAELNRKEYRFMQRCALESDPQLPLQPALFSRRMTDWERSRILLLRDRNTIKRQVLWCGLTYLVSYIGISTTVVAMAG